MDSKASYKLFKCKIHPKETIQRVFTGVDAESPLKCIECLLSCSESYGKESLVTLNDFLEKASKFYESMRSLSKIGDSAPSELVEFLSNEDAILAKLQAHIEEQKEKLGESINSLLHEFTILCHTKKEQISQALDKQFNNLKANFAYYKAKLDKYYNSNENDDTLPTKEQLYEKINNCSTVDDLELLIKNIKDDIMETNGFKDSKTKIAELRQGMKELSLLLKEQTTNLPRVVINDFGQLEETLKKFKDTVDPFLNKCTEIEPVIDEFSLVHPFSMDSKIVTKLEDKNLLKKWIKDKGNVRFKLLYRGSRDGFDANTFHSKCDGYSNTLTIIRSNHNRIFGGFTDLTWNVSGNYKMSTKSWIFSLDAKARFGVKSNTQGYAIYAGQGYGPTFGGGHDIYIASNGNNGNLCYSNLGHTYDASSIGNNSKTRQSFLAGAYNFAVEEIEVFYVDTKFVDDVLDSNLISSSNLSLVKSWIGGKNVSLQLLYRASKDGFDAQAFHNRCDFKGPTLVVCKSAYGRIFGGFTSKGWSQKEDFVADDKAFVFSLTDKKKLTPISPDCAIFASGEAGPIFGAGYDLFICPNSNILEESHSNLGLTYDASGISGDPTTYLGGASKFLLEEIEVFKVA